MENQEKETRLSKYDTHVLPRLKEVKQWCKEGLIDEEISKRLGISRFSLNKYKNTYPEFLELMIESKLTADYRVQDALYNRALGYNSDETTKERKLNKETGEYETVITKVVTKEVAPDPTSMIFWLKNRMGSDWKDKQDINLEGSLDINSKYSHLTDEDLDKEVAKMKKVLEDE